MSHKIITGRVRAGEGLGRATGFPTANLDPALIEKLGLEYGVYAAWGTIDKGTQQPAIVIVGTPYKFRRNAIKLEVYFLDFDQDIRGRMLTAEIVAKIRPMADFTDLASLLQRIEEDIVETKKLLG